MLKRFEQFTASISCIYRYIQQIERDAMEKYGLRGPHAQCLIIISQYPDGITAARLCELCEKDKAAVSRILSELEKEELIERKIIDTGYRAPITLTDKGMTAAKEVGNIARKAVSIAGKDLDDESRKIFYSALDSIAANLHKLSKEGLPEND